MTIGSTRRSGNFSPKWRRSDFRRRTMTGSRSRGLTGTPRVKRCGSLAGLLVRRARKDGLLAPAADPAFEKRRRRCDEPAIFRDYPLDAGSGFSENWRALAA